MTLPSQVFDDGLGTNLLGKFSVSSIDYSSTLQRTALKLLLLLAQNMGVKLVLSFCFCVGGRTKKLQKTMQVIVLGRFSGVLFF